MNNKLIEMKNEISKVVIGQENVVDALIIGLLCDGHILLEGLPGLAKTTTVKAMATTLGLDFKRVQFTPDLLPSDIIGTQIYDQENGVFKIRQGPVFTNILLADEINRAPAKVQSALLEAMQEKQITIGKNSLKLDLPFLVLATQNPIESEGAYQLPEAQLDRFMIKAISNYNTAQEELQIAKMAGIRQEITLRQVLDLEDLKKIKESLKSIHIDEEVEKYMIDLIFATRYPEEYGLSELKKYIMFGASPRASIDLFKVVRAKVFLKGKDFVSPVDIAEVIKDVVRHRIVISYEAEADGVTADDIIDKVISSVDIP